MVFHIMEVRAKTANIIEVNEETVEVAIKYLLCYHQECSNLDIFGPHSRCKFEASLKLAI